MSSGIEAQVLQPYKYGFVTDIESETVPPGLSEDVIRLISEKKGEPAWMLEWRLKAYRNWLKMPEPHWANVQYGPIDYQAISYYAAPELVQQYVCSVVPYNDNFFAALNSAVFTDGSFVYVPKGVRCPMELSTYFRINAESTGQFERTLIVADEGSYVSYLEGCSAPVR